MSKRGDVYVNPVTGERVVIRVGTNETRGQRLLADLYVRPRGAVPAEHYHPAMVERFTVVRGRVGFVIGGVSSIARIGETLEIRPGVRHDWWNAGDDEAHVLVDVEPAARFEEAILNGFGFAQDGKTDAKGLPKPLQLAVFAGEFSDVIRFSRPPRLVQILFIGLLSPIARLLGYRGSCPKYLTRGPSEVVEVEDLPTEFAWIEASVARVSGVDRETT